MYIIKNRYYCFMLLLLALHQTIESKMPITKKSSQLSAIGSSVLMNAGIGWSIFFPFPTMLYNAGANEYNITSSYKKNSFLFFDILYPGEIETRFEDVAGLDGAKEDIQDVIDYMGNPEKFRRFGARMIKGILMNGPSGNGKTLLARAAAGEVNCPFISVKGSDFSSHWGGVGAERVRQLFAVARQIAPCIIFIDEIDVVAAKRSSSEGGIARDDNKTITVLLTEMDGLCQYEEPVIVFAATNRLDQLDAAIKRPGRFDRIIQIEKPLIKDRMQLLQIAFADSPIADDVDFQKISYYTLGFSGAQIAHLANEAKILAAKQNADAIGIDHIETAYDVMTLGRQTKGMVQTDEELWSTAVHEAGHVIGYLFQDGKIAVHKVSITPRNGMLGVAHMIPLFESYDFTKEDMQNKIVCCLAGRCAQEAFGFGLSTGAASDLEKAQQIAYEMVATHGMVDNFRDISYAHYDDNLPNDVATKMHEEVHKIIEKCRYITIDLIADHKDEIEKIARLLFEKGTVQGDEIYAVLGMQQPVNRCIR